MTVFGLDISHHQDLGLDMKRCKIEGIEFVFIKATEGSTFTDPEFSINLAKARAAGMLVAAYHYVRANATAAAQVVNISRTVPRDVPVILDIEANSIGSAGLKPVHEIVSTLRTLKYSVPLTYLPKWYWQQIGKPSLTGLPPLWSSRYPDNVVGTLADEWRHAPASYWAGYGGLDVAVLQFTSSARIAGHAPLDANAYPGTKAQLAALLGGKAAANPKDDDLMFQSIELPATTAGESHELVIALPWQGGSGGVNSVYAMLVAGADGLKVNVAHWRYLDASGTPSLEPVVPDATDLPAFTRTAGEKCPVPAHALILNYSAPAGAAVVIEAAR
jgi:hypothetical protein